MSATVMDIHGVSLTYSSMFNSRRTCLTQFDYYSPLHTEHLTSHTYQNNFSN